MPHFSPNALLPLPSPSPLGLEALLIFPSPTLPSLAPYPLPLS